MGLAELAKLTCKQAGFPALPGYVTFIIIRRYLKFPEPLLLGFSQGYLYIRDVGQPPRHKVTKKKYENLSDESSYKNISKNLSVFVPSWLNDLTFR